MAWARAPCIWKGCLERTNRLRSRKRQTGCRPSEAKLAQRLSQGQGPINEPRAGDHTIRPRRLWLLSPGMPFSPYAQGPFKGESLCEATLRSLDFQLPDSRPLLPSACGRGTMICTAQTRPKRVLSTATTSSAGPFCTKVFCAKLGRLDRKPRCLLNLGWVRRSLTKPDQRVIQVILGLGKANKK